MMKIKRAGCFLLAVTMMLACWHWSIPEAKAAGADANTPMTHPNTYINTGDQRKDIIGVALTQVGYTELNHSNNTKYGAALNINHLGWCGAFVSWCAIEAEVPNSIFPKTGVSAPYAFGFEEKYYPAYTPQPGDLFFAKDNSHVGLVYTVNVEEGYFMSLEGNVSYNSYEGVHIEKHWLSNEKYCSPAYETKMVIADSGDCGAYGSHMSWTLYTSGKLLISGSGEMEDYSLGKAAPWYKYRESINELVVQDGVTALGNYAFYECQGLEEVTVPNSVTVIGESAFSCCTGLETVNFGTGLVTLEGSAFYGCAKLKRALLPDSLTKIGTAAFYECISLGTLDLGDSVTSIGNSAFASCYGLTALELPASLKTVGNGAFFGCNGLTEVEIPASVISLGSDVFGVCINLTSIEVAVANTAYSSSNGVLFNKNQTTLLAYPVGRSGAYTIPDGVVTIGPQAFQACSGLTAISIPDGVTTIGENAFLWCHKLRDVSFPDSVTTIGASAFSDCDGLTWVMFGASLESIGAGAFARCGKLTNMLFNGKAPAIAADAFAGVKVTADHYPGKTWTEAVKQNYGGTITWVEQECVHIYNGVETKATIGAQGFTTYTCTRCEDSYVGDYTDIVAIGECGEGATWSLDIHGELIISGGATDNYEYTDGNVSNAPWAAYSSDIRSITLGNGVTAIGTCAFMSFEALTEVTIPASVTTIGASAFQWCSSLKKVYFEGSAPTIGANTFYSQTLTAYYNPGDTWTDAVRQNYGGTVTWVAEEKCEDVFTDWMKITVEGVAYQIRICKKCGKTETDMPETLATQHHWVMDSAQTPTCTEPGCKEFIHCADCDLAAEKELVDALGHAYEDYVCTGCQKELSVGDFDGNGSVTDADVIWLLWHTVFPEDYPLTGSGDFNGDGSVTDADVIYLLWHTVFPEDYPLNN